MKCWSQHIYYIWLWPKNVLFFPKCEEGIRKSTHSFWTILKGLDRRHRRRNGSWNFESEREQYVFKCDKREKAFGSKKRQKDLEREKRKKSFENEKVKKVFERETAEKFRERKEKDFESEVGKILRVRRAERFRVWGVDENSWQK